MDWVPFVLEDAKRAMTRWPNAQDRGMWAAGFYSGAAQALTMGGEPEAFLDGYACGSIARGDADKNRARISEVRSAAARARWDREQPKQIVMDANAYAVVDAFASPNAHAQAMHKTDKQDKQDKTEQTRQTKQAKNAKPTEQEWVEYCAATWTDWQRERAAESWAYYEGKGWLVGKSPCKDWKAVARTAHGNARDWGKLGTPSASGNDYADKTVWPFGDPAKWPPSWIKHPTENRPFQPGEME